MILHFFRKPERFGVKNGDIGYIISLSGNFIGKYIKSDNYVYLLTDGGDAPVPHHQIRYHFETGSQKSRSGCFGPYFVITK